MPRNEKSKYTEMQERQPRKDKGQAPGKTNDWDRDAVHGDGDTVGIERDSK
ncbi:hypothetical protein [Mesorhizobium humile]|jgi:hypothetical protein|uniref:Uncharacterized protein n=1 Tax=Mesorhizobium humile TaxID=3072313 RepID=A0ABU4YIY0_9HYPH|nr:MULTISPECIES: hypothetical protein [unclassified Mesorhizobium]MDX8457957.1 hypothetical protein [Mesorhizobium sp. VK2D]MDX8486050.1 hypothetical protein [Mesorhizobium sp. VK2B]